MEAEKREQLSIIISIPFDFNYNTMAERDEICMDDNRVCGSTKFKFIELLTRKNSCETESGEKF